MTRGQSGLEALRPVAEGLASSYGLVEGRVIKTNARQNTVDVWVEGGGLLPNVPVARSAAGTNLGSYGLPWVTQQDDKTDQNAPGTDQGGAQTADYDAQSQADDTWALVGFIFGRVQRAVVLGFVYPPSTALSLTKDPDHDRKLRLDRHVSGVYQLLDADGTEERVYPDGLRLRVGHKGDGDDPDAALKLGESGDYTVGDTDAKWTIPKDDTKRRWMLTHPAGARVGFDEAGVWHIRPVTLDDKGIASGVDDSPPSGLVAGDVDFHDAHLWRARWGTAGSSSPKEGEHRYNSSNHADEFWNGSKWTSGSETGTGAGNNSQVQSVGNTNTAGTSATPAAINHAHAQGGTATGDLSGSYPSPTIGNQAVTTPKIANQAVTGTQIAPQAVTAAHVAPNTLTAAQIAPSTITDTQVAGANKNGAAGTYSMRTLGTGAQEAAAGNDSRFLSGGPPTGTAGGALLGTYPNPSLGGGVVGPSNIANASITAAQMASNTLTHTQMALANLDGAPGLYSLRTLGNGANQACAGNDTRLSDGRAPIGGVGGTDLGGTYPSPTIQNGAITNAKLGAGAVTPNKLGTPSGRAVTGSNANLTSSAFTQIGTSASITTPATGGPFVAVVTVAAFARFTSGPGIASLCVQYGATDPPPATFTDLFCRASAAASNDERSLGGAVVVQGLAAGTTYYFRLAVSSVNSTTVVIVQGAAVGVVLLGQ